MELWCVSTPTLSGHFLSLSEPECNLGFAYSLIKNTDLTVFRFPCYEINLGLGSFLGSHYVSL